MYTFSIYKNKLLLWQLFEISEVFAAKRVDVMWILLFMHFFVVINVRIAHWS